MEESGAMSGNLPNVGERFGTYEVLERLGEGGMGTVFRARSAAGEAVALKVIRPELAGDLTFRARFDREARTAAMVRHPHVVGLVDVGEQDGVPYLASDYVPGGTLEYRLRCRGRLPLAEVVTVALQVADGLGALHAAGLVHRDLKPGNILLGDDGAAYISDFGLAKHEQSARLTAQGRTVGSAEYMPPEQVRGLEVGPAADVYALGCVVCECLGGAPPFAPRTGMDAMIAHLTSEAPDPCGGRDNAPPELGWAVLRALQKDPGERPPTAIAYARMIQLAAAPSARPA